MPAKNVIKNYSKNYFYHIYNRGGDKRNIFIDGDDYRVFTYFLRRCVDPKLKTFPNGLINTHYIADEVDLVAYCLMPNHFHLMLKLNTKSGITKLLQRSLTSYAMYFNKKYERQGSLFQGKPKGIVIKNEPHLVHLTRYIHLNPLDLETVKSARNYPYSSYKEYLGLKEASWIKPKEILKFFKPSQRTSIKNILTYESFVENYKGNSRKTLRRLTLE